MARPAPRPINERPDLAIKGFVVTEGTDFNNYVVACPTCGWKRGDRWTACLAAANHHEQINRGRVTHIRDVMYGERG